MEQGNKYKFGQHPDDLYDSDGCLIRMIILILMIVGVIVMAIFCK